MTASVFETRFGGTPVHSHDCEATGSCGCMFCGQIIKHVGSMLAPPVATYDVYFTCSGDLLIRAGVDGDYWCAPMPIARRIADQDEKYRAALNVVESAVAAELQDASY